MFVCIYIYEQARPLAALAPPRNASWATLAGWRQSSINIWMVPFAFVDMHTCWLLGSPQRPLAFLYLPANGSRSNWRSGCPDAFALNLSAHTAAASASDLAAPVACMWDFQAPISIN